MCIRDSPRTTSVAAMEIHLSIEPLDLYFKKMILKKIVRNRSLPLSHPLSSLAASSIPQAFTNRAEKLLKEMTVGTPELIPPCFKEPPWDLLEMEIYLELPKKLTKADLPELLRQETLELLNTTFSDYVKIYSDGSVNLDLKKSGAGYYNQNSGESFYAPTNSRSSMDAELTAINAPLVLSLIHI